MWISCFSFYGCVYVCTQPLRLIQETIKDQFLCGVQLVWIQTLPSPRLVAIVRLKRTQIALLFTKSWVPVYNEFRSIKKENLSLLSLLYSCCSEIKEHSLPYYLLIAGEKGYWFMPFLRALTQSEMQATTFSTWTWLTDSISNDDVCVSKHTFECLSLSLYIYIYIYIYMLVCVRKLVCIYVGIFGCTHKRMFLLIDFSGMSTCLGLFYPLGSRLHCTIIFFVQLFLKTFSCRRFNRIEFIFKHFYLTYKREPRKTQLRVRVDLEIMRMNEYFTLPRSPELESHH